MSALRAKADINSVTLNAQGRTLANFAVYQRQALSRPHHIILHIILAKNNESNKLKNLRYLK